ncbi:type III pantothenate kinase [Chloroflexota bacterium]
MLLAVDIGNTEINLGVFNDDKLQATWHVSTGIHRTADEYAVLFLNLLQRSPTGSDIDGVAMCSVVPPLTAILEELCQRYLHLSPLVVGAGIKTGVHIRMDNPREVGADRIVNAAAAHHLYGGSVIIIDLGTATTFDVVSKEGDYMGGAIAPGIRTSAEGLFMRAAMLPRVEMVRPNRVIGTNTIAAMQSGIVFGYVALIDGMVARIQEELGEPARVVATGGFAEAIATETSVVNVVNPDLTLVGLRLIYQMNRA